MFTPLCKAFVAENYSSCCSDSVPRMGSYTSGVELSSIPNSANGFLHFAFFSAVQMYEPGFLSI
jgi:hypothetical protein